MRGGPPRASMKLDNRPKKLLVKGASGEQVQDVRDWYEVKEPFFVLLIVNVWLIKDLCADYWPS
jgi:hypothetical protein